MARFFDPLPIEITYEGQNYELTPAFDNVLVMCNLLEKDDWTERGQRELVASLLFKDPPEDPEYGLVHAALEIIMQPAARPKNAGAPKIFDFTQDSALIYAAFMQAYGIDLFEQQGIMHWQKFIALLHGLPDNTKFAEVLRIRAAKLPASTRSNTQERVTLMRLKAAYALEQTEAEKVEAKQDALRRMACAMLAMAKINAKEATA